MIAKGSEGMVVGPLGFAILIASWSVRKPRPSLRGVTDAVEALAILLVALGLADTWQAIAITLASLWYRSLAGSRWSVVVRVAVYSAAVAGESVITEGGVSWDHAAVALGSLPFWAGTAFVARRMGLMLVEHDKVSAIGAIEAALSAHVVARAEAQPLAELALATWHDLSAVVPGLRIARMEKRDGSLHATDRAGLWEQDATASLTIDEAEVPAWDRLASVPLGHLPQFDDAAGEHCRWGLGPQLDSGGLGRVLIGAPARLTTRLVTAATSALERIELLQQHAQDHALLGVQAHTDALTGLDNRLGFFNRLSMLEEDGSGLCLVFLDLDDFKDVNDMFGHAVGDEVLCGVAERFRQAGANAASVARLGGDEFGLLFEGMALSSGSAVGERAEAALEQPVETSAGPVHVGVSWGVATVEDGDSSTLLARADAEMYRTKRSHRALSGRDRRRSESG